MDAQHGNSLVEFISNYFLIYFKSDGLNLNCYSQRVINFVQIVRNICSDKRTSRRHSKKYKSIIAQAENRLLQ